MVLQLAIEQVLISYLVQRSMKRDGGSHARVRFRDINISDVLMCGASTVGGNYYLGRDMSPF